MKWMSNQPTPNKENTPLKLKTQTKQQGWAIFLPYNSEAHEQLMDTMEKKANFFEES
jgi:hypothetical protein